MGECAVPGSECSARAACSAGRRLREGSRQAGKRGSAAAGHSVTRRPTHHSPSISSISCSSSLAFHHQKYFSSVTQLLRPAPTFGSALARTALARPWPRCARKVQVFEPERASGRGARGAGLGSSNGSPRTSARARDWSLGNAAMTSETGVRSAPRLVRWRAPYTRRDYIRSQESSTQPKRLYRTER